jgi:uncharacterized ParB-like nuclease family protein
MALTETKNTKPTKTNMGLKEALIELSELKALEASGFSVSWQSYYLNIFHSCMDKETIENLQTKLGE